MLFIAYIKNIYLFEILGILTFYLNFWSMPLLTLGMPIICLMLCNMKNGIETKKILQQQVVNSISWICGFAGTVLLKQFVNYIMFQNKVGLSQMAYWGGKSDSITLLDRMVLTLICVGRLLMGKMVFICCILIGALFVVGIIKYKINIFKPLKYQILLIEVSSYPLIWFWVAAIHTRHGFDKNMCMISFWGILMMLSMYFVKVSKESET